MDDLRPARVLATGEPREKKNKRLSQKQVEAGRLKSAQRRKKMAVAGPVVSQTNRKTN
jgi:hypothetical protein